MRLLHIEDDTAFAAQVGRRLESDAVTIERAATLQDATARMARTRFDGVLLDLALPDGTGLELLRRLRAAHHDVPVLVLSGQAEEDTMIAALDAGADDYVIKPVSLDLLRARVRALLRRGGAHRGEVLRLGGLVVDLGQREAWADGTPLGLSPAEFNLLAHLAATPGRAYPREVLLTDVWGYTSAAAETASNVVDVTVGRLRRRLGEGAGLPRIEAVRGVGYALRAAGAEADGEVTA